MPLPLLLDAPRANESFCHIDYQLIPWIGTGPLSPLWVTSPARGQTPCVDGCRRLDPCLMHSYAYALVRGVIRAASALAFWPERTTMPEAGDWVACQRALKGKEWSKKKFSILYKQVNYHSNFLRKMTDSLPLRLWLLRGFFVVPPEPSRKGRA